MVMVVSFSATVTLPLPSLSSLSLSLSLCRVFSLAPPRVRVCANKADCGTIQILLELLTDCANIRQSLP